MRPGPAPPAAAFAAAAATHSPANAFLLCEGLLPASKLPFPRRAFSFRPLALYHRALDGAEAMWERLWPVEDLPVPRTA